MNKVLVLLVLVPVVFGVPVPSTLINATELSAICRKDQYVIQRKGEILCKNCTDCPEGEQPAGGIAGQCPGNTTHDRTCEPCPTGYFKNNVSNTLCVLCQGLCAEHEYLVRNCTAKEDRYCSACPLEQYYNGIENNCYKCSPCCNGHSEQPDCLAQASVVGSDLCAPDPHCTDWTRIVSAEPSRLSFGEQLGIGISSATAIVALVAFIALCVKCCKGGSRSTNEAGTGEEKQPLLQDNHDNNINTVSQDTDVTTPKTSFYGEGPPSHPPRVEQVPVPDIRDSAREFSPGVRNDADGVSRRNSPTTMPQPGANNIIQPDPAPQNRGSRQMVASTSAARNTSPSSTDLEICDTFRKIRKEWLDQPLNMLPQSPRDVLNMHLVANQSWRNLYSSFGYDNNTIKYFKHADKEEPVIRLLERIGSEKPHITIRELISKVEELGSIANNALLQFLLACLKESQRPVNHCSPSSSSPDSSGAGSDSPIEEDGPGICNHTHPQSTHRGDSLAMQQSDVDSDGSNEDQETGRKEASLYTSNGPVQQESSPPGDHGARTYDVSFEQNQSGSYLGMPEPRLQDVDASNVPEPCTPQTGMLSRSPDPETYDTSSTDVSRPQVSLSTNPEESTISSAVQPESSHEAFAESASTNPQQQQQQQQPLLEHAEPVSTLVAAPNSQIQTGSQEVCSLNVPPFGGENVDSDSAGVQSMGHEGDRSSLTQDSEEDFHPARDEDRDSSPIEEESAALPAEPPEAIALTPCVPSPSCYEGDGTFGVPEQAIGEHVEPQGDPPDREPPDGEAYAGQRASPGGSPTAAETIIGEESHDTLPETELETRLPGAELEHAADQPEQDIHESSDDVDPELPVASDSVGSDDLPSAGDDLPASEGAANNNQPQTVQEEQPVHTDSHENNAESCDIEHETDNVQEGSAVSVLEAESGLLESSSTDQGQSKGQPTKSRKRRRRRK